YHQLDEASRQVVLQAGEQVYRVLRPVLHSREEQVRLNVLQIIRDGGFYRASYLIEGCLQDRLPRVREAAAATLHDLADRLLQEAAVVAPPADLSPEAVRAQMVEIESYREDRRQLVSAIAEAVTCFGAHL